MVVLEQGQRILSGVSEGFTRGHRTWQGATLLVSRVTRMGIPMCTLRLQVIVLEILTGVVRERHTELPRDNREHNKRSWDMPGTCPVRLSSHRSGLLSTYLGNGAAALGCLGTWYCCIKCSPGGELTGI